MDSLKKKLEATGIAQNTVTSHICNLNRIANNGLLNDQRKYENKGDPKILKNSNQVMAYINSNSVSLNVKKTLLNSVIRICKVTYPKSTKLIETYEKEFQKIADRSEKARTFAKPNEKEQQNKLSIDDLIEIRNQYEEVLEDKYTTNDYKYVLLCLYTMMPPLRTNEWIDTQIFEKEPPKTYTSNFINLQTGKMHIRESKTKRFFGERIFDLPKDLLDVLKNNLIKSGSNLVLPKIYNLHDKTTESNVAHVFNTIVGKKLSTQMLRKIYVSEMIDNGVNKKERLRVAYIMGHSPKTAFHMYSKFSNI